jgi:hypothetical protein
MGGQPTLDGWRFVRGGVVEHNTAVQGDGHFGVDRVSGMPEIPGCDAGRAAIR